MAERVVLAEALARLESPYAQDDLGDALVIDVPAGSSVRGPALHDRRDVGPGMPSLPTVTIARLHGPAPETETWLDHCDVVIATALSRPDAWTVRAGQEERVVDRAVTMVQAHPHAALVLAQTLRAGSGLDIANALTVESLAYGLLQAGPDHQRWLSAQTSRRTLASPDADVAVEVTRAGETLSIRLNRPEKRNALNTTMRDQLIDALRIVAADPRCRAVLSGNGPAFCSGGDLEEFGSAGTAPDAHLVRSRRSVAWWMAAAGPRIDAEVHGACVGAGTELLAWARTVTAAPGSWFALPELGMGLIPGAGGSVSLGRRMHRHRVMSLALCGERIDAPTALAWGLVDRVTPEAVD